MVWGVDILASLCMHGWLERWLHHTQEAQSCFGKTVIWHRNVWLKWAQGHLIFCWFGAPWKNKRKWNQCTYMCMFVGKRSTRCTGLCRSDALKTSVSDIGQGITMLLRINWDIQEWLHGISDASQGYLVSLSKGHLLCWKKTACRKARLTFHTDSSDNPNKPWAEHWLVPINHRSGPSGIHPHLTAWG